MSHLSVPMEITPTEVNRRLAAGEKLALVDVREPFEHQQASIPGADLIPMRNVPASLQTLEGLSDEVPAMVVFCHHGVRSLQVVNWLREQGIGNCQSMTGGIDRWSSEVDPAIPRYF